MATLSGVDYVEDVFDEEDDMHEVNETEWKKLKEARLKDGYADGKYLGEESTVQSGFNHGYWESFEFSYPISIIQGLLAVVEMQIVNSESVLIERSRKIKFMLDSFKEKLSRFKLECLLKDEILDDDMFDCEDENCNEYISENSRDGSCYFSRKETDIFEKNKEKIKIISEEFKNLKDDISRFIRDCNQPAVLNQISRIYDTWSLQYLTRFSPCKTQCTCVNESSCTSRLFASA